MSEIDTLEMTERLQILHDWLEERGHRFHADTASKAATLSLHNAKLVEALEWALDNAGAEHPHYPYRDEGRWVYPYLVNGTPLGGGVGLAGFSTALEAVQAALNEGVQP